MPTLQSVSTYHKIKTKLARSGINLLLFANYTTKESNI